MNRQDVWLRTATGQIWYPFDLPRNKYSLEDIAQHLSRNDRYNGGAKWPHRYSVLEHSVMLARYALREYPDRPTLALQLLAHDFAECYIPDMPRPIKDLFPEFQSLDNRLSESIFRYFGIPWPMDPLVKVLDTSILLDEENEVLADSLHRFNYPDHHMLGIELNMWDCEESYCQFFITWAVICRRMKKDLWRPVMAEGAA